MRPSKYGLPQLPLSHFIGSMLKQRLTLSFFAISFFAISFAVFSQNGNAQDKLKPGRLPTEIRKSLVQGLLVEYFAADNQQVLDINRKRLPALLVKPNQPFTPFIKDRELMVRFSGYIKLKLKGAYRLTFQGTGQIRVFVNDDFRMTDARLDRSISKEADLIKGYNKFELVYFPPKTGAAKLRVYWEHESIPKEPIPPIVFFSSNKVNFRTDGDSAEQSFNHYDRLHKGRQIFLGHNCVKCHTVESEPHPFYSTKDAPDLAVSGKRLETQWLQQWLMAPNRLRNETTMPQVFGLDKEKTAQELSTIADLTAFIQSLGEYQGSAIKGDAESGGDAFENLGCIGCHHFSEPQFEDEYERISLHFTAAKFRPGSLAEFLLDSRAHYQWSRMPQFRIKPVEAANLETFIREESSGRLSGKLSGDTTKIAPSIENGKRLFSSTGCANCHSVQEVPATVSAPNLLNADSSQGCLVANRQQKKQSSAPDFSFDADQTKSIQAFIKSKSTDSISRINDAEFAAHSLKSLRCITCHDLDDQQATLPYIIEEEGAVGLPPNRVPMLTYAGEKLLPNWSEKLISGKLNYRVREHFRVQMPGFPQRGKMIAQGLSSEHGFSSDETENLQPNKEWIKTGESVAAMETGLSCNRCHAIADRKPNAAFDAQSTNLIYAAERLRKEYYMRWMLDPIRIDKQTKMPRFSEDRKTTSLKSVADGDAQRQFEALWHFLNSIKQD